MRAPCIAVAQRVGWRGGRAYLGSSTLLRREICWGATANGELDVKWRLKLGAPCPCIMSFPGRAELTPTQPCQGTADCHCRGTTREAGRYYPDNDTRLRATLRAAFLRGGSQLRSWPNAHERRRGRRVCPPKVLQGPFKSPFTQLDDQEAVPTQRLRALSRGRSSNCMGGVLTERAQRVTISRPQISLGPEE